MKNISKITSILLSVALFAIFLAACPNDSDSNSNEKRTTHFSNELKISGEQVWLPNYSTGRLSEAFIRYTGDRELFVTVGIPEQGFVEVGSGEIKKGIINFTVPRLNDEYLLNKDFFLATYFSYGEIAGWYGNISFNDDNVKSNILTLITSFNEYSAPNGLLIKEGFSGTQTSLTGEYIYYIYVDRDCVITAGKVPFPEIGYTFNAFELKLKKGWNTICRSESFDTEGRTSFNMEVKNPDLKWLLFEM